MRYTKKIILNIDKFTCLKNRKENSGESWKSSYTNWLNIYQFAITWAALKEALIKLE